MRSRRLGFVGLGWVFIGIALTRIGAADDFEHMRTGFPLTGAHERIACEACHVGGRFAGTPTSCGVCHVQSGPWEASFKSSNHVPSSNACSDCHITSNWSLARFDHRGVTSPCVGCHNGAIAGGRSLRHVPSSNDCELCHSTLSWSPATFDHSLVTGSCVSCHNGAFASGKSRSHIPTVADCGDCHTTVSWNIAGGFDHSGIATGCSNCHNGTNATGKGPAHVPSANTCEDCHTTVSWNIAGGFDHSGIATGCFNCHNGTNATGKGPAHVPSANTCEDCHDTRTWSPARFDHSGILGGCGNCHNGTVATGKSSGHFITNLECDECHSTLAWEPIQFSHRSPNYPGDHAGPLACNACHLGNAENVPWKFGGYQPDCAACHADDYKIEKHKKVADPKIFYTVSELRDCAGSCHTYTDPSLTTIEKIRTGKHRVSKGDW